jgi:clan AA aspartic protease
MIVGQVNANFEAAIELSVIGTQGEPREVEAVIDTGYNGFLTLPPELVAELRLESVGVGQATLANGRSETFELFAATVVWDGLERLVDIDAAETTPLVGMLLLEGYDLHVRVKVGEPVVIERLLDDPDSP